jgi:signal peptidase I
MTKRKSPVAKPRSLSSKLVAASAASATEPASSAGTHVKLPSSAAIREAIESVAIAFILAFLFRTFEAEAFVIPTGSMAPTLMGRHKDVICPKCHCPYQVSASEEVNSDGSLKQYDGHPTDACLIDYGTCPMCRYTASLKKDVPYNGDRILVNKFAYEVADPERWDVIVFKYPGDPPGELSGEHNDSRTNFIKRLVGLPGETIRIENGDVWLVSPRDKDKGKGAAAKSITHRSPAKLLAMLQPVFDNDYMPRIADCGWPERWSFEPASPADANAAGAWRTDDKAAFSIDGTAKTDRWLRYHHLLPADYYGDQQGGRVWSQPPPVPQLITDFTAYNTGRLRMQVDRDRREDRIPASDGFGMHWVGDLALACTVDVESPTGELTFELCKGGRRFQCRFDLSTGRAALSILGQPDMPNWRPAAWHPSAATKLHGKGRYKIIFSNCDDELRLWVDGAIVSFDAPTSYPHLNNTRPDATDLAPAGIASAAAAVRISHLRLLRDIYYIADCYNDQRHDVSYLPGNARPGAENRLPPGTEDYVDFPLKADQFFVLGDNSAKSKDARLWGPDHFVPRDLLIGKAMFIYWPHSWDRLPYVDVPFPYFPNFSRMGLVR